VSSFPLFFGDTEVSDLRIGQGKELKEHTKKLMKRTELCLVSTWSDRFNSYGQLALLQVNDTIHVVEYKDSERSIAIDIDLIELRDVDSTVRFTFPRGSGDRLVFRVDDRTEFSVLCQAREDCQAICDLKLRLNSILRDSYYSGVYSNLDPDAKLILCDEVERMKKENPGVFFSSLLNSNEVRIDSAKLMNQKTKNDAGHVLLTEVICVFCDASKLSHRDLDFLVHPYVPKYSSGRHIFMCSICVENWKEFRETAEHDGQLILPGEINEEICAICSDTPSTLVMCGECPRSFCHNCLLRTLTQKEYAEITNQEDADWVCMCCTAGFTSNPSLLRNAWKAVIPCAGRKGMYHGTVVPYTESVQKKTDTTQPATDAAKIKHALNYGASLDAAVSISAPLMSSLASKRASRAFGSPISAEEESISEGSSAPPARGSVARRGRGGEGSDRGIAGGGRGRGRGGRGRGRGYASYALEDVDSAVFLQAQYKLAHPNNDRGKRMEKRQHGGPVEAAGHSGSAATSVTTSGPVLDEKYYFGQYVGYYALLCEEVEQRKQAVAAAKTTGAGKRKRNLSDVPTDDVCFLCKDGGELIECDWVCPTGKNGERCLKVYHTYCLDFEVSDEKWCCPRHYCDMCGSQSLKYICKYCPVSICANCPSSLVSKVSLFFSQLRTQIALALTVCGFPAFQKYGHARYCAVTDPLSGDWCHAPTAAGMQTIACQSCTEMLEAIERSAGGSGSSAEDALSSPSRGTKGSAPIELVRSELQKQKRFPGTYAGPGKGGAPSIYLKEAPPGPGGSSDDRTESTEKMVHPVRRGRGKAAASVKDVEVDETEEAAGEVAGAAENEVGQNMRRNMEEQRGTTEETPPPEVYRGRRGRGRSAVPARSVGQDVNLETVAEQAVAGAAGKEEKMEVAQDVAEETSQAAAQTALQAAREEGEEKAVHPPSEDTPTGADVPDSSELADTAIPPAEPAAAETAHRQTAHPIEESNSYTNSMEDAANALLSIAESGKKRKAGGFTKSKETAEATSPDVGVVPALESIPADHVDVPPPQKHSTVRGGAKHPATKPAKEALVPRNDAAAECTSPPKKRAASSLAQFNISMQLKGDAAVDGRSPRSAAVESAPNASKSADTKKGAHKATTGASVAPATPAATQKAGDGKKTATPKSAASKTSSKAAPSAAAAAIAAAGLNSSSSSDEEDEQVIQIARRVTRSREGEVLSTRSGKKLVLAGSDLLPGLD
jgi:hypothetical protein